MKLKDKLKDIKPRENSGSMASNRFDFQKNWAICKLIELTKNNDDFMLAFEYHEDIIVFDTSDDPTYIDFFQIKTKDKGKFNLNNLLKKQVKKDNEGNSILGKLLNNRINFEKETNSLNLVCNAYFSFKSKDLSKKEKVAGDDLNIDEKKLIENSICLELKTNWVDDFLKKLNFSVTDLTIDHHNEITKSKLNTLIEEKYSSDIKYNPSLAYRTIFDEINRRNNIEKVPSDFEELIKYKAVSKQDFENFLNIVITEPNKVEALKSKVFDILDVNQIETSNRLQYSSAWKDLEIELLKINNSFFNKTRGTIKKIIHENLKSIDNNILTSIDILYEKSKQDKAISSQSIYSEYFLKLLILIEIYND